MESSITQQHPILVVDDDPLIREVVAEVLADEGYESVTAEHGAAALRLVQENQPSIILLDMKMPVMDGWEFVRAYRERPGPHAPVIAVTAAADAQRRAQEAGADDVLPKPFIVDDLLDIVSRYLAGAQNQDGHTSHSQAA